MSASGSKRAVVRAARLLAFVGVLLHATLIPWAAAAMALAAMPASHQAVFCRSAGDAPVATGDPAAPAERSGHCEHCKSTACGSVAALPSVTLVAPPATTISHASPRGYSIARAASVATLRNRGPPSLL
ncbi:MAG: DUF2946 family protein [Pseudomonadota bacterium]